MRLSHLRFTLFDNTSQLSETLPNKTGFIPIGFLPNWNKLSHNYKELPMPAKKKDLTQSVSKPLAPRSGTKTSTFVVSKREGHDASLFYERFPPMRQDKTEVPNPPSGLDQLIVGDSRSMSAVANNSVALVVTSPPYYAAKAYELEREKEGVPSSYAEYLQMLHDVFMEAWRVLEPGGRIAINVANLGRRPYRSLSADVIRILQDDVGFLLRGEILWMKAAGASGSCAWGSFQSAANPVLRDLSERVIIGSKLRLDRTPSIKDRKAQGLPHANTISKEDFMALTLDVWHIRPESARKVGHPAPFPVELPRRLIELYTYAGDLILDPFIGSGSSAIAAIQTGRHYVGYDMDASYIDLCARRIEGVVDSGGI